MTMMRSATKRDETLEEPVAGEGSVLASLGEIVQGLRLHANRHIFRTMLATSGAAAVLMRQLLPDQHWLLPDERTVWSFAKLQARNLARLCGVSVEVRGLERIAAGGPFVFTPNHQSHFDIAVLLGFLPGHNRFAAKKELFRDPILGPVLKSLGMIPVDRDRPLEAIRRLNQLGRGSFSVVVFPEGTRSPDGRLQPFKKGAFVEAIRLGMPVVPVAIRGGTEVMPKGGHLGIRPGRMEMIVEEPIETKGLCYEDRLLLSDQARAAIERHLDESGSAGGNGQWQPRGWREPTEGIVFSQQPRVSSGEEGRPDER